MRCVLEAAVAGGEEPKAPALCQQIERCKDASKARARRSSRSGCTSRPTACTRCRPFARKGWPNGLIKKLFYNLYETDVVFEDAYGVWREDVVDSTPGKDKALFQVNEFLQWLDEAAEEGEDAEEDN